MAVAHQRPKTFDMPTTNKALMSNAARQAKRAGARESSGNGTTAGLPCLPVLEPSGKAISKRPQSMSCSRNSTQPKRIWLLFFRQYVRHQWRNSMASNGAASAKWRMDSAEFLGGILFDAYSSLQILIPPSRHHFAVTSTPLKETVAQLGTYSE